MAVKIRKCGYIKVNGTKCGSPALKGAERCYFHAQAHSRLRNSPLQNPAPFPVLDDANAVQLAVMEIIHELRFGHIEEKLAGKLLYALQIASYNLKHMKLDQKDAVRELLPGEELPQPAPLPRVANLKYPYEDNPICEADRQFANVTLDAAKLEEEQRASWSATAVCSTVSPGETQIEEAAGSSSIVTPTEAQNLQYPQELSSTVTPIEAQRSGGVPVPSRTLSHPLNQRPKTPSTHLSNQPAEKLHAEVHRKMRLATRGSARAARELFEFAGIMPRRDP